MIKKFTHYCEHTHINENLQRARAILRRNEISEQNEDFQKLRTLLATHPGYLGKFTEWLIVNKITYDRLEDLYDQIKDTRLSRPIDDFKTPEEIIDTIVRTTADTAVNQMIHAIPSKAREFLRNSEYCENCDNEREVDCDYCDGDGSRTCSKCDGDESVDCPDCKGDGAVECTDCKGHGDKSCKKCKGKGTYYKKDCPDCDGDGTTECKTCESDGEVECKRCEGDAVIECDKCKGEGGFDCTYCKATGKVKCEECSKESNEWKEFLRFLSLQATHKDIIIDFFSKKGGRYSNDDGDWDYEDESPLDELTQTITKLINIPSIDSIIEKLPEEVDVKLIHNDDTVLIIASNYEGLQKFGSSYWCIHQDEYTFNDYVYPGYGDSVCEQWIMYIKGKTPLVDEKSVMGITYDIKNKVVRNAHWEDDDECERDAKNYLRGIKLDGNLVLRALDLYDHDENLMFQYPEAFSDKIEVMFSETKEAIEQITKFKEGLIGKRGRKPSVPDTIKEKLYKVMDSIADYIMEDDGDWTNKHTKLFTKLIKKYDIKLPVRNEDDLTAVIISKLYPYVDFIWSHEGCTENIFELLSDNGVEDKESIPIIKWMVANGYDLKPYLSSHYAEDYVMPLYRMNLVSLDALIGSDVDLEDMDEPTKLLISKSVLEDLDKYIKSHRNLFQLLNITIKVLSTNTTLLAAYKQKLIDKINLGILRKDVVETILEGIDDDDVEMACARQLLHRKILTKYDVEMKKKMLEKLVSYKDFRNV